MNALPHATCQPRRGLGGRLDVRQNVDGAPPIGLLYEVYEVRSGPHKSGTLGLEAARKYVAQARGVTGPKLPMAGARQSQSPVVASDSVARTRVAVCIEFPPSDP